VAVSPELTVSNHAVKPTVERESGLAPVHAPLNDKGLTPKEAELRAQWDGGGRKGMLSDLASVRFPFGDRWPVRSPQKANKLQGPCNANR
jgi:hypothetical protein